jgi:hypothetical protein
LLDLGALFNFFNISNQNSYRPLFFGLLGAARRDRDRLLDVIHFSLLFDDRLVVSSIGLDGYDPGAKTSGGDINIFNFFRSEVFLSSDCLELNQCFFAYIIFIELHDTLNQSSWVRHQYFGTLPIFIYSKK